jgi:hypothetical protein
MATVLVVANETLASHTLLQAVKERAHQGDASFVLACPMARASAGFVSYDEVLRHAAESRLDAVVAELENLGIAARGEVFDPDPFTAVTDAVREFHPDEIIISTHPQERSGWLRRDLIDRVKVSTDLPVRHVVADLDAERGGATHTLVVAAQTVEGRPLLGLLKGKSQEKDHRFVVVVPQQGTDGAAADEARDRLSRVLEDLEEENIVATGSIGDPDPYTAVMSALNYYKVDEIVISTLPAQRSGWLRADLVERVRRSTSLPVEHVVVDAKGGAEAVGQEA